MKMKKKIASVLAAIVFGSVSAISFAEISAIEASSAGQTWTDENGVTWNNPFDIRDDSDYSITIENAKVNGKNKAAVKISGIPGDIFSHNFEWRTEKDEVGNYTAQTFDGFITTIDIGNQILTFKYMQDANGVPLCEIRENKPLGIVAAVNDYQFCYIYYADSSLSPDVNAKIVDNGGKKALIAYIDDDNLINMLTSKEDTTAMTFACLFSEKGEANSISQVPIKFMISSKDGLIEDRSYFWKERVKITNNLNVYEMNEPETSSSAASPPQTSSSAASTPQTSSSAMSKPETSSSEVSKPTTSVPTASAPADSASANSSYVSSDNENKSEIIDVTIKSVDSENGLSGVELEKQVFGDSNSTWAQTEKIEFTSDKLFSVRYTAADGSTKTLGEKAEGRAANDGIWNTAWTLDTSLMSKDKPSAKLISKDGTADITAKVYVKTDAKKPSDSDGESESSSTSDNKKPIIIAVVIVSVVLAAGAVIVISKKRK